VWWSSAVVCLFVGSSCCVEGVDCCSVFGGGPSLGVGVRERGKGTYAGRDLARGRFVSRSAFAAFSVAVRCIVHCRS